MAIEFVAAASGAASNNNIPVPAVNAGDLIILLAVRTTSLLALTAPSGYATLYENLSATAVFYKIAPEDAGAVNVFIGNNQRGASVVYRGVDPTSPFADSEIFRRDSRSSVTLGALAAADRVCVLFAAANTNTLMPGTPLSGFSEVLLGVNGAAYDAPAQTWGGAVVTYTRSEISAALSVGLIAEGGTPVRRRSPLMLTPW